jgi:isoaspartyl peptidase/L-asparaginase-like protein (Ntn-hydrolase superfamily)
LPKNPVLVIHGGAWAMVDAHIRGVNNALTTGWRVLERSGSALDADTLGPEPQDPPITLSSGHAA